MVSKYGCHIHITWNLCSAGKTSTHVATVNLQTIGRMLAIAIASLFLWLSSAHSYVLATCVNCSCMHMPSTNKYF